MPLIIPQSQQRLMRWKNGGGVTREIMRLPQDSSLELFDWRISVATVKQGGAFSTFSGVDRSLVILTGTGLALEIDGAMSRLTPTDMPLRFDGEAPVRSTLLDGDIVDFNVMTRRGRYCHNVERITLICKTVVPRAGDITVIYLANGSSDWSDDSGAGRLHAGDALLLGEHDLSCELDMRAAALVVTHLYRQD